jgi:hypothetical protein
MNAFQKSLHLKTAKILSAVFIVGAIGGPTAMNSADPKTRSHFTAKSARPLPTSDTAEEREEMMRAEEREGVEGSVKKEVAERLEEAEKRDSEQQKRAARQESERKRLEGQQQRLQEKLHAQVRDEKRRREKELAARLAQEEALAEAAIRERLELQEVEAERALRAKMEEEARAKEIELERIMAQKAQLAQEAMVDRIAAEENQGILAMDQKFEKKEVSLRDSLENRIAKEERRREAALEKRITSEEKAARKELEKRLAEREKLAEAELLAWLESEEATRLEDVENRVTELAESRSEEMAESLKTTESEGLREIEKSLLERAQIELGKRAGEESGELAQTAEPVPQGTLKTKPPFRNSIKYVSYTGNEYDDFSKRPAILRTVKRAPRNLVASLGNLNLRRSAPYPGYLAYAVPPPLRFSDSDVLTKRAASPALPEFSFVAPGSGTEIIESELSEETARRNRIRRQVVVELDPYTIVSGRIDTAIPRRNQERDLIMGDEFEEPVVRPEEVLIFFENEREGGAVRTIAPFSPALPQESEPSRSGATYNRVE